jgi:hypothetical protein
MVEEQQRKKCFFFIDDTERHELVKTHLAEKVPMQARTAKVLHLAEGAAFVEGRRIDGDVWLGSVMSCVEHMKRLELHATFVIKGHTQPFPMGALHSCLLRHNMSIGLQELVLVHVYDQILRQRYIHISTSTVPIPNYLPQRTESDSRQIKQA